MMVSGLAEWNAEEAGEFCRLFCSLFEALSREADQNGKHTWCMKPKLHLMQESCLRALHGPYKNIMCRHVYTRDSCGPYEALKRLLSPTLYEGKAMD